MSLKNDDNMRLLFRGVRGSRPTPNIENMKYGGNTSCVEIRIGKKVFIFDAGTGIIDLGNNLMNDDFVDKNINIFITHSHWDHIQGIPFFSPIYNSEYNINFFGEAKYELSFEEILKKQMSAPFFPVNLDNAKANLKFIDISDKNVIVFNNNKYELFNDLSFENNSNDLFVSTCRLNHPNASIGFKIEYNGKKIVYATDSEMMYGELRESFIEFSNGVDLLIYDSQYTEEEYNCTKKGWGHSTWNEAVRLAMESDVKNLYLFHHSENRTDVDLEQILCDARKIFKNTFISEEGKEIIL